MRGFTQGKKPLATLVRIELLALAPNLYSLMPQNLSSGYLVILNIKMSVCINANVYSWAKGH